MGGDHQAHGLGDLQPAAALEPFLAQEDADVARKDGLEVPRQPAVQGHAVLEDLELLGFQRCAEEPPPAGRAQAARGRNNRQAEGRGPADDDHEPREFRLDVEVHSRLL